MTDHNNLLVI